MAPRAAPAIVVVGLSARPDRAAGARQGADDLDNQTIGRRNLLSDPQHTEPATHTVLVKIREMVVNGEIAPGARLRAEALATQLDVSRTPIRSALAVLSAEGLVRYSVNKGYTVNAATMGDVLQSIEVRAGLEGLACRGSIEYGWDAEALAAQADLVARGRALIDPPGWSEEREQGWYGLNWTFHRTIAIAAHNAVLRNALRMTLIYPVFGDVVRVAPSVVRHVPLKARQLAASAPAHLIESQADHEAILKAMQDGDADEGQRLMTAHVLKTRARILTTATLR